VNAPAIPAPRQQNIVPSGVLAMVIVIACETMFFAALISSFLVLRAQNPDWPPMGQPRLPVRITGVNTMILLFSGYTMQRALWAVADRRQLARWLALSGALGTTFLAIQGYEWVRLIGFGLTTSSSLYGATFYALVGAHGFHVLVGLVALLVIMLRGIRGHYYAEYHTELTACYLYWLFVVAVWPVLYVLVYLQ